VATLIDDLFPKTDLERLRVAQMVGPRPQKPAPAPAPTLRQPAPKQSLGPWVLAAGAALFVAGAGAVLLWLYGR
jgi:hypothetical protein